MASAIGGVEDMENNLDFDTTPKLTVLFLTLSRRSPTSGRRSIQLYDAQPLEEPFVDEVADGLLLPGVGELLRPHQIIAIAQTLGKGKAGDRVRQILGEVIDQRWDQIGADLLRHVIASGYHRDALLRALPRLAQSPELHDIILEFDTSILSDLDRGLDLDGIAPPTIEQLRRALPALNDPKTLGLQAHLLIAAARQAGWTPWLRLFGILLHARELAAVVASDSPPDARGYETDGSARSRRDVWAILQKDAAIRKLAALITDLGGALADSPPDVRSVFVGRLRCEVGQDAELRCAVIEALLWEGSRQGRDAAIFAAIHLIEAPDLPILDELAEHPLRHVPYSALIVREAVTGRPAVANPTPPAIATLVTHARSRPEAWTTSRTWIGNPILEDMISATVAALESQFAIDYERHHRSGEERLAERFFAVLGDRFENLEHGLMSTVQAMQASRSASIRVGYRPVDKPEEGGPGILRPDSAGDRPKFAADFCLVVDAYLNGRRFARRASLVQAKRLYLRDNDQPDLGWRHSFDLKPEQTRALLDQTSSSFYLFQGPPVAGRGLPVIPAQLVEDLAQHQQASGAVLAVETVGQASESFAQWFTEQVIGLRTGDPLAELVTKAEGGPGAAPYPLVKVGVMEIEVRVGEPTKLED